METTIDLTGLTTAELHDLSDRIADELASRQPIIKVTIPFGPYNSRRYGRPWIAVATEWTGPNPELDFGMHVGDDNDGGELIASCAPGSVVRWGQKDLRRRDKSTAYYGVVAEDGRIHQVSAVVARKTFLGEPTELPEPVPAADLQV